MSNSEDRIHAMFAAKQDQVNSLRDIIGRLIPLKDKYKAAFNTAVYALEQALLQLDGEQTARHQRERDFRASLSVMQRQRDGAYERCQELMDQRNAAREELRRVQDEASAGKASGESTARQIQSLLSQFPPDWNPRFRLERSFTFILETGEAPAADEGRDIVLAGGTGASHTVGGSRDGDRGQSGGVTDSPWDGGYLQP